MYTLFVICINKLLTEEKNSRYDVEKEEIIMIGILLISHGPLAQGLKETYCFFNDESDLLDVLCLQEKDDPADFHEKLSLKCDELDQGDGILIFCDIPGGISRKSGSDTTSAEKT